MLFLSVLGRHAMRIREHCGARKGSHFLGHGGTSFVACERELPCACFGAVNAGRLPDALYGSMHKRPRQAFSDIDAASDNIEESRNISVPRKTM